MKCEFCKGETRVITTATTSSEVFRYRRCIKCGKAFYTTELKSCDQSRASTMLECVRKANSIAHKGERKAKWAKREAERMAIDG